MAKESTDKLGNSDWNGGRDWHMDQTGWIRDYRSVSNYMYTNDSEESQLWQQTI